MKSIRKSLSKQRILRGIIKVLFMTKKEELISVIQRSCDNMMNKANQEYFGPYMKLNEILNPINELAFELRSKSPEVYKDLQWIREHLFFNNSMLNVFTLGRLVQILKADIFVQESNFWKYMHPHLVDSCMKMFQDGYYANSVEVAFKEISSVLRKFRKENSLAEIPNDANMIQNTFNEDNNLLTFSARTDTSEQNIHKGYRLLFEGAMYAFRNPSAHANILMAEDESAQKLIFASNLMFMLDRAISDFQHKK